MQGFGSQEWAGHNGLTANWIKLVWDRGVGVVFVLAPQSRDNRMLLYAEKREVHLYLKTSVLPQDLTLMLSTVLVVLFLCLHFIECITVFLFPRVPWVQSDSSCTRPLAHTALCQTPPPTHYLPHHLLQHAYSYLER